MHLIAATDEFTIARLPKPGFPILLWEDMSSCWQVNAFLRYYLSRGSIGSKKSWEPTGRAMYDYFSFLEVHTLLWNDVDRGEDKSLLAAYRDYCFDVAKLARSTVRQRLLYVCEYYAFAKRQGWIASLPYRYEDRWVTRSGRFLSHVDASGGRQSIRSVMPRKHMDLPRFLTKQQVQALLGAATNPHHHMIIRTALHSGLRREELATLPVVYIFDPSAVGNRSRNVRVTLDPSDGTGMKTKGNRKRDIFISSRLMKDLHHYVVHLRGERASLSEVQHQPIFLNQTGAPWADDGKGIERVVSRIGKKVNIKTHPHMLRHTYATHTLAALQKHRGEIRVEPLVFLQKQLGHNSLSTTMVYLHLVNELVDNAVLAYDDELNDSLEAGT